MVSGSNQPSPLPAPPPPRDIISIHQNEAKLMPSGLIQFTIKNGQCLFFRLQFLIRPMSGRVLIFFFFYICFLHCLLCREWFEFRIALTIHLDWDFSLWWQRRWALCHGDKGYWKYVWKPLRILLSVCLSAFRSHIKTSCVNKSSRNNTKLRSIGTETFNSLDISNTISFCHQNRRKQQIGIHCFEIQA